MKKSRLFRRYNKKGRIQKTVVIQQPTTNVAIESVENNNITITTDEQNPFVLPSKKRQTKIIHDKNLKKRKLSKKERKRLEKIIELKEKKANRIELLKKLGDVQIKPTELAQLHSIKKIGEKPKRKRYDSVDKNTTISENVPIIFGRKKRVVSKKIDNVDETISQELNGATSSDDDDDQVETEINDEDLKRALKCDVTPAPVIIQKEDTRINKKRRFDEDDENDEDKPAIILTNSNPNVHVQVNRTEEIQSVRSKLPIINEEQSIMEAINENSVVLICGETGSGKTTQLPQFLYEAGYTSTGKIIGVTEPRRVAATTMAARVGEELNLSKSEVSYQIRYEGTTTNQTQIKFMTDGVLLKEIKNDFLLTKYSCIIIDEAHERSVYTDVLIGFLSRIVPIRYKHGQPLKLIIMSATLRIEDFIENKTLFKVKPKIINIESRQYPVSIHFNKHTFKDYIQESYKKICKIHRKLPPGGILVFVTGQQEVKQLCTKLKRAFPFKTQNSNQDEPQFLPKTKQIRQRKQKKPKETTLKDIPDIDLNNYSVLPDDEELEQIQSDAEDNDEQREGSLHSDDDDDDDEHQHENVFNVTEPLYVLPLYALLPSDKQARVFQPPPAGCRLCVVATNVAETSITISSIKYVVDCGKVKMKFYDKLTGVSTFRIVWTSKAGANQRSGRAGRTAPGHCYRLYSSAVFNDEFEIYSSPEIAHKPVEDLVLQLKTLNIDHIENFPFPTPPDKQSIYAAEKLLLNLGALETIETSQKSSSKDKLKINRITELGQLISSFPVNPRYGKMLALSYKNQLLQYVIAMVAALSVDEMLITGVVSVNGTSQENKINLDDYRRQWIGQGESLYFGDVMVLLKAVGAVEYSNCDQTVCDRYGIRFKAISEVRKIRKQLTNIVKSVIPDMSSALYLDAKMTPPNDQQILLLRKIMAAGMVDRLAKKIEQPIIINGKKVYNAYQTLVLEESVFVHPSSVLLNEMPSFVCYQDIHETSRMYMRGLCSIDIEWIPQLNPHICQFGLPEDDPSPRYDSNNDKIMCHRKATIGRLTWTLPKAIETDYPDTIDRYRWFGKFFLDGQICLKLEKFKPVLLCSSNSMVKSWANLMKRTEMLLNALVIKKIYNKKNLLNVWKSETKYLLDIYCDWIPESLHNEVKLLWPPL